MTEWLLSLDTDKIKEYVFATGRLKEMRGASALLDSLNRGETKTIVEKFGGELVFASGGSAMGVFTDEDQAKVCQAAIQQAYLEQTGAATITGVVVEIKDYGFKRKTGTPFKQAMLKAGVELQKKKAAGRLPAGLLSQPHWARCQRCGAHPVVTIDRSAPGGPLELCAVCAAKRQASRRDFPHNPMRRIEEAPGSAWMKGGEWPENLNDLGTYIALIYADGNGVGRLIEEVISTKEDMKVLSQILDGAVLAAVVEATQGLKHGDGTPIFSFQPIILGGDDVILAVKAQVALQVANTLCLSFQKIVKEHSSQVVKENSHLFGGKTLDVAMSAGVVIAKAGFPLFSLDPLAESLLIDAKRLSRTMKAHYGQVAAVNFQVITSPSANKFKREEFKVDDKFTIARPYPCQRHIVPPFQSRPSMTDLLTAARLLREKGFARNKLHQWQDILRAQNDLQMKLDLSAVLSHLSSDQKKMMAQVKNLLNLNEDPIYFYDQEQGENLSPLPDLEEIFEFAQEGER